MDDGPRKTIYNRKAATPHDRTLYRQRHKIENMFGRLKDWRRIRTRYDCCAHTFMTIQTVVGTPDWSRAQFVGLKI